MSFEVAAQDYGRFMGRFSEPLADELLAAVERRTPLRPGLRALDVGAGPGALTVRLAERLGEEALVAVEPSAPFVAALRDRLPGVEAHQARAEELPLDEDTVDLALAQLVVHFMTDPVAGMREMARVTRPGGVLAATVWDHAQGRGPLAVFWRAARELDPGVRDESTLAGAREGHLTELAEQAGWVDVEPDLLRVEVAMASFDAWWEPFTLGVGPAGAHVAGLPPAERVVLRDLCARTWPDGPFSASASAWCVTGRAG